MTRATEEGLGLTLVSKTGVTGEAAEAPRAVRGCYDCSTCSGRAEFARSLGRSPEEVQRLGQSCGSCGHRLHRHFHGLARGAGLVPDPDVIAVEAPPRESPLGQRLMALGQYDSYHRYVTS